MTGKACVIFPGFQGCPDGVGTLSLRAEPGWYTNA